MSHGWRVSTGASVAQASDGNKSIIDVFLASGVSAYLRVYQIEHFKVATGTITEQAVTLSIVRTLAVQPAPYMEPIPLTPGNPDLGYYFSAGYGRQVRPGAVLRSKADFGESFSAASVSATDQAQCWGIPFFEVAYDVNAALSPIVVRAGSGLALLLSSNAGSGPTYNASMTFTHVM